MKLVHTDSLDWIVVRDATTPVMVVTTSMVLVILAVSPDGRDMTVILVMAVL